MKQYNRRKEQMVEVSEPFMNELFSHSCMELQKIFEKIGHQEWDRFEKVLKEVLAIGKRMQEEEDKGKIHYVIFSFLQYGKMQQFCRKNYPEGSSVCKSMKSNKLKWHMQYQYICGLMLKSMSEHIMELLSQSELSTSDDVVFLYGEYMDKAVTLYQGGR